MLSSRIEEAVEIDMHLDLRYVYAVVGEMDKPKYYLREEDSRYAHHMRGCKVAVVECCFDDAVYVEALRNSFMVDINDNLIVDEFRISVFRKWRQQHNW